ncbi:MAG TPA: PAS domain S-box protein, partial [Candidatus Thermoplasmatota archaeon]|nr:PAS domain S-box protein [Candidatus Thermoplasmatota archaeon]
MTNKNNRSIEESILTQSNTLFCIIDDTGKITYESPSIHQSKIFSKKLVNTSIYELLPKKDQQKLKNNIQKIIENPTQPTSCRLNFKNKTKQKWKITAKNLLDHTTIQGILLSFTSVDEIETSTKKNQKNKTIKQEKEKRAALKSILEEKKEQYQLLVNHATEGICVAQDGILKFVNPKLCKMLGDTKENILLKPFIEFIHPDDQSLVSNRYKNRIEGKSVPEEYLFRTVDNSGHTHWVQIHAARFTWEDKPATVNFINEVTEKIFTKQKFEKLFDSAPLLTAEIDAETLSITYVNNAF